MQMEKRNWKIFRKSGWVLNPDDKLVNGILKGRSRCDGHCPCHNKYAGTDDDLCPCKSYIEDDVCCCKLYIKE